MIPDRVGIPVRGHRLWVVFAGPSERYLRTGALLPLNWPAIELQWPPGVRAEARCADREPHAAPAAGCRCGLYALRRPLPLESIIDLFRSRWLTSGATDRDGRVWIAGGHVDLWGKIIEGEHGWRAQFAYPRKLKLLQPIYCISGCVAPQDPRTATTLAQTIRRMYRREVAWGHCT